MSGHCLSDLIATMSDMDPERDLHTSRWRLVRLLDTLAAWWLTRGEPRDLPAPPDHR